MTQHRQTLDAARRGDPEALSQLLASVQARIYRFGMKMCRDPHDAEEVLQETLIAMMKNLPEFRGESSITSWAYAIARSFCIKQRRRSKFAPLQEDSLDREAGEEARAIPDEAPGPEHAAESSELRATIDRALTHLDPIYRDVIVLRDIEGLSAPEVGEVMDLSVAAVKSRLHRARKALKAELAPLLDVGVPAEAAEGCPDTATLFSEHLEGELDAADCAAMEAHLEGCAGCRGTCEALRKILSTCQMAPSPEVPAEVQEAVRRAVKSYLSSVAGVAG